ncbi:MAG: radical SAM protein [Clostridia bacterium]|nr:radical SAM protein [Clostridia bacterium]
MACKYCYLEDNTKELETRYSPLETLAFAVDKFKSSQIIPFNISLHGGEVTTLNAEDFYNVIAYIDKYYKDNRNLILNGNFKIGSPHIKTNLYDIEKHIDTIKKFNVSISGSLDLPFSSHDEFRVTKGDKRTLDKILENIKLLEYIPNNKKVSATIFKEHYEKIDEIISDIKFLHENTCLNMNDFNFMIGFEYNSNGLLTALTEEEQVDFYHKIHEAFEGTDLEYGLNNAWFTEFGPDYCTNCNNCGTKFFLLERNGDIYSCVRGQKHPDFYYGNIYTDEVDKIMQTATNKIAKVHGDVGFNDECANCGYLYLCKTGCPFVKKTYNSNKSYTCKLQQELYKDKNYKVDYNNREMVFEYISNMHPNLIDKYALPIIPRDVPNMQSLIVEDPNLKYIYDTECFVLKVDSTEIPLESQIIKLHREFICITPQTKLKIYVKENVLEELADYPENNALYIQLLSGDTICYGDEQRNKQKHIANCMIYKGVLASNKSDKDGYYCFDISNFIKEYSKYLSSEKPNNLFFTTTALRDYHYTKQKNNGYYHIQAINLPFQNIEFTYLELEGEE